MQREMDDCVIPQYSLAKIMAIWAAAAVPMGILGWVVSPALARGSNNPFLVRMVVLTIGLVWQFGMVVFLVYREAGSLSWTTFRQRLWLQSPRSPQTGRPRGRYWWWLIPILLLTALFEMAIGGPIDQVTIAVFPFLAETPGLSFGAALATPAARAQLVGAWGFLALFLFQAVFNTFIGEELLFRGILLPRMSGVFGKWDFAMNGLLFGFYHLHQPWIFFSAAIEAILLFCFPSRYFRSSWFGIIAHSGQSIYFSFLLLGLILGLA
jgi:uncharacterized protein